MKVSDEEDDDDEDDDEEDDGEDDGGDDEEEEEALGIGGDLLKVQNSAAPYFSFLTQSSTRQVGPAVGEDRGSIPVGSLELPCEESVFRKVRRLRVLIIIARTIANNAHKDGRRRRMTSRSRKSR